MVDEQLAVFEREIVEEEIRERENIEKEIQTLHDEKVKIVTKRKQKIQETMSQLGGNKEEHQKLILSHSEDTQRLVNKMDAERLRMEADLQDRIRKRKAVKRKDKEEEMKEELLKNRREREEMERLQRQIIAKEEKQKLEALHEVIREEMDTTPAYVSEKLRERKDDSELPDSLSHGLPLSEEQLTAILVTTPLYRKLEQIKKLLQNQPIMPQVQADLLSESYIDPKDASWVTDKEFHPVDINTLHIRAFVVYKFGCSIMSSLVAQCNHTPVSLLIADRIPPNQHFSGNAFRNSFAYDANNRILYLRQERLQNVGEFVLVLVHSLSHINTGSFTSDSDPVFVKEFYHSMSICCSELFFSKHRHSSKLHCIDNGSEAVTILESMFSNIQGVTGKLKIIDEILDTQVKFDQEGGEFTRKALQERLDRYQEFQIGSKLRAFLDRTERDITKSREDRPLPSHISGQVTHLGCKQVSSSYREQLSWTEDEATQSLSSGTEYARSKHSPQPTKHVDQYKHFLEVQIHDLQERVDNLNKEHAQQVREQVEKTNNVQSLQAELNDLTERLKMQEQGSGEFESQRQTIRDTSTELNAAKTNLAAIELRVSACSKHLDALKAQLQQKQNALEDTQTVKLI